MQALTHSLSCEQAHPQCSTTKPDSVGAQAYCCCAAGKPEPMPVPDAGEPWQDHGEGFLPDWGQSLFEEDGPTPSPLLVGTPHVPRPPKSTLPWAALMQIELAQLPAG